MNSVLEARVLLKKPMLKKTFTQSRAESVKRSVRNDRVKEFPQRVLKRIVLEGVEDERNPKIRLIKARREVAAQGC